MPRKAHVLHCVMGDRRHAIAAVPLLLVLAVMLLTGLACVPPPINPGYISIPSSTKGKAVIALMGGGAYEMRNEVGYGGGAFLVDPFVTQKLSIPFGLSGGGGNAAGAGAGRLGLRYRAAPIMSLGGGVGGGLGMSSVSGEGALFLDLEIALGGKWSIVGLSLALRPTIDVLHGYFFAPISLALALYPQTNWAFTFHVLGSPWIDVTDIHDARGGWIGGGIGFVIHVG